MVFFHGGGWVAGVSTPLTGRRAGSAIETGAVVVRSIIAARRGAVSGAFEDAFAAQRPPSPDRGIRRRREPLGGPVTAPAAIWRRTTAIACRDAGIKLAAQLLVDPVTDVAGNFADAEENARFPSRSENAEGYFLTRATMEWFCGHYLADKRPRHRLACLAAAHQKPRRPGTGDRRDRLVRSAPR